MLEFRILGPLEVVRGGRAVRLAGTKQRALLAILLLRGNEVVSSDRLIEELWGAEPPETAASALRVHVAQLRKLLTDGERSAGVLLTRAPGYVLTLAPEQLDLDRFERLAERGRRALSDGRWEEASTALREALALWRGEPLADLAYEPFALSEISRLEELRLAALEDRIEADLERGRHGDVVSELETLVREHPLRERLRGQLMVALYRSGRQAEALDAYRQARRALVEELGIEPSTALQHLEKRILRQDPSLDLPTAAPPPVDLVTDGVTRPLTVLIANVDAAATRADDDASELPADVVDVLVETVFTHGGKIDSLEGTVLCALFGTPTASEDDPERALLTAIAIRDGMRRLGLQATAAVATGDVGRSVVHLAERLRDEAQPGRILASAATHRLTRLSFEFAPVKLDAGVSASSIPAYEVRRSVARPQKTRGIEGLRAALRGRDGELAELRAALRDTLAGDGRLVAIGGEAGVGKSRLVAELRAETSAAGTAPRWLEGRCRASGGATSYLPYVELLSEYFAWVPEDDDREREKGIVSAVLDLVRLGHLPGERVGELVALLANLLSVRLAGGTARPLERVQPEQVRNRTFAAVRDFVAALAAERPLVLVLEDFQWADTLSVDLTAHLMEAVRSTRVLLVVVSRPDPLHRWRRLTALAAQRCGDAYRQLELQELSEEDTLDLLHALLPTNTLSQRARDLILTASEGNPFFLEEILQSLIDTGVVYQADGRWQTRTEIESLVIPESVETVILSRVDRLDPPARRVLETGSVVGRSFSRRMLAYLVADDDAFERALWELQGRGLIYEDRVVPEEEYSFKHALTQEAVYRSIPEADRAALHEQAAAAIEALNSDGLEEHYEQLAYHHDRGADASKAVAYLVEAGEKSRRRYLNADAIDYFERALARLEDCAGRVPHGPGRPLAASIRESLGDVLRVSGRHEEAIGSYKGALALLGRRTSVRRARLHRKLASTYHLQRRVDEAHAALDAAAAALGDVPSGDAADWWQERVEIELKRLWLHYFFGEADVLLDALTAARPLVEEHGTAVQRGRIFNLLAAARFRRDRAFADDETLEYARDALSAAQESGDAVEVAQAHQLLGLCLLFAARLDEAAAELKHALALAERAGDVTLQLRCLPYLTLAYRRRGAVDEVRTLAPRTLAVAESGQMLEYVAQAKANLAWLALREGDLASARKEAGEAWDLWQRVPGTMYRAMDWIVLWPLVGATLAGQRSPTVFEHVRRLLDATRMPADVRAAAESAATAWERGRADAAWESLEEAADVATRYGYL